MKERLQKVLSHAGICSRRKAEELIEAGQVRVNGKVIRELGSEADPVSDRIEVAGERIRPERKRYFFFYGNHILTREHAACRLPRADHTKR